MIARFPASGCVRRFGAGGAPRPPAPALHDPINIEKGFVCRGASEICRRGRTRPAAARLPSPRRTVQSRILISWRPLITSGVLFLKYSTPLDEIWTDPTPLT
ncbi:hypothetical protein EVAR_8535_1 [Eumeta japonica]|uniref:Uncharacterized protein n=1 Tax=Eumeta variegata TaxID=151549 RepID=A0A4C1TXJ3_EUMVA|nr:hypothetical protein EVAR_8535_1 [Eumeta japonica]